MWVWTNWIKTRKKLAIIHPKTPEHKLPIQCYVNWIKTGVETILLTRLTKYLWEPFFYIIEVHMIFGQETIWVESDKRRTIMEFDSTMSMIIKQRARNSSCIKNWVSVRRLWLDWWLQTCWIICHMFDAQWKYKCQFKKFAANQWST